MYSAFYKAEDEGPSVFLKNQFDYQFLKLAIKILGKNVFDFLQLEMFFFGFVLFCLFFI